MRIYKISSEYLLFYHATIPQFCQEIIDSGQIKPSKDLDISYQGWNFSQSGHNYGDAIFLANHDEKSLAIYYASIRLRKLWEEIALNDSDPIAYDEDLRYIGVFSVYISKGNAKLKPHDEDKGESLYFGDIRKNDLEAYWTGPEWISREKEADEYYNKLRNIAKEMKNENI